MWRFKKKNADNLNDNEIKWYAVGSGNPFDAPIIDLRSFTLNNIASTKDENIAKNYLRCPGKAMVVHLLVPNQIIPFTTLKKFRIPILVN